MKPSLVEHLVCPTCRAPVTLTERTRDGEEIMEGFLRCTCGIEYPIIQGVPRMLPPELLPSLRDDYPEFYRQRTVQRVARANGNGTGDDDADVKRRTQEAFGYEWTWAADYHAVNFTDWLPEQRDPKSLFDGRMGLEIGCGAGRHSAIAATYAREHFAVDLSRAVDSAFARNRNLPNCHVIQADAFRLPFRPATFDYVFCLGVLQHLPDPERGFFALAQQPRRDGILLVNVYQASRPVMLFLLELARKITTRMPNPMLRLVSVGAGYVDYGLFIAPWQRLQKTRLGRMLRAVVPERIQEYAKHDLHTCVTDWFDRLSCPVKKHYKQEDLRRWYERAGYDQVSVTPYWKAFWNGYGQRTAGAQV